MENVQQMKTLIKEYEESEAEFFQTKKLYDQLQQLVLQENEKQRKEMEVHSVKKVSSDTISALHTTNSKSSTKGLKDTKSSLSSSSTRSFNLDARPNISKSVERRIHHLENYKNIMKQSKVPPEKLGFLDLLNNSS